jgi:hypothetical protein
MTTIIDSLSKMNKLQTKDKLEYTREELRMVIRTNNDLRVLPAC